MLMKALSCSQFEDLLSLGVAVAQEEYAQLHEKYQAIKAQRLSELESMLSEQTKQVATLDLVLDGLIAACSAMPRLSTKHFNRRLSWSKLYGAVCWCADVFSGALLRSLATSAESLL